MDLPKITREGKRQRNRVVFWSGNISRAETGDAALTDAVRWLRKELAEKGKSDPKGADAACWWLARIIAVYAAQMPHAGIEYRRGLTDAEVDRLHHPFKK